MEKKHALIIGGTRGIGKCVVEKFLSENYIVSVVGTRTPESIEQHADRSVKYWLADIVDELQLQEVLTDILRHNGKLNYLVCLQRFRGNGDDWSGEIETTLSATRSIIEMLREKFNDSHENSIVLANSVAAHLVVDNQPLSYHVAKAGIDQMIRYYAVKLGYKGIRVNGISPSTILKDRSKDYYLKDKELYEFYQKITPLKRMGTAEEIADVIHFLCSPKSSFITGQTIVADGGLSLQWQETLAYKFMSREKDIEMTKDNS